MATAIEFDHIGKQYRLGLVSTRTLSHDLNRWWQMAVLKKEDPYLKIGEINDRSTFGTSEYVWALNDINFTIEQGDVVGIIGKNGAGKSTLLKLLSKVTGPTVGSIRARGRIGALLEVGTGFHSEMTGRENIYMNGAIMGMTKNDIAMKLDEIIAFSGCERYIDTPVKRYSSGMTVRLGFAVAAHLEPEILVVDEVLAVGDADFQKKAIGKMKSVSQHEGRTVLFVSHNMASIRSLCKTGVLLENGYVKYSGEISDVVNKYLALNINSVDFNSGLASRIDRLGNGRIRLNNLLFRDKEGNSVNEIFVGDYLRVDIYLNFREENIDLAQIILACGFEDMYGNRVNEWVSDEMPHDFSSIKDGFVSLVIPSLNLRPNTYYFHHKIMYGNTEEKSICDMIHFGKVLTVMPYVVSDPQIHLKKGRGYEAFISAHF